MAAKLNKSFLATVLVVSTLVVLVVGGIVFYMIRLNPERNIRAGDELMAAGEFEAAANEYGRAVNKESGNVAYLRKFEEALLKVTPGTSQRASELYGQWISVLSMYSQLNPMDEEPARRLLEELYSSARLTNMQSMWGSLVSISGQVLERNPELAIAQYYNAAAQDRQSNFITTSEGEIRAIQDELERQVEEYPDDPRRLYSLYLSNIQLAFRDFIAGRRSESNRYFARAAELFDRSLERFPDNLELTTLCVRFQGLRIGLAQERNSADDVRRALGEKMQELLDRTWELGQRGEHADYVIIEASEILGRFGGRTGTERAIELLRTHLGEESNALFHRYVLAKMNFDLGDLDQAEVEATKLMDTKPMTTSFMAQLRFEVQQGAARLLFDVAYARYDRNPGSEEGQRALATAREARDRLASMFAAPDQAVPVALCDAWLALADRQFVEAAAKFEFALAQQSDPEFRTYIGASRALEGRNELGAARQRLLEALEVRPNSTYVMTRLSRITYMLGEHERAEAYADAVLEVEPDNAEAMAMRMESRRAQNKEVAANEVTGPIAVVNQARQQRQAGDIDGARATLTAGIQEYEQLPALRLMLIEIEANAGNRDRALELIAAFRERFPNNPASGELIRIEGLLRGEDPVEIVRRIVEQTTPDAADQPIRLYASYADMAQAEERRADAMAAQGNREGAEEARRMAERFSQAAESARAEAERASPDHPALVEYRFREALLASNWAAAERLVAEARSKNLDRANGYMYEGRLAMARNRFVDAATALVEATRLQPHDSDTWRLLGRSYELVGNTADAARAYASSYERDPTDAQTVRMYANLLLQTGRNQEALVILRAAKSVLAGDAELRDARLTLEAQFGNSSEAIQERRQAYEENPDDLGNAIRLALLLGSAQPQRNDVVDRSTGNPRYSDSLWGALAVEQREALLKEVQDRWVQEGRQILNTLAEKHGQNNLQLAVARAFFLRDRGQAREGEQVLQSFAESQRPPSVDAMLRLADYQGSIGRIDQAIATMEAALALQDPKAREADAALARLYFSQNQFERAKRHWTALNEVSPSRATEIRLIECDINLRNFAEAQSRLDKLMAADDAAGRAPTEGLLLGAAIDRGAAADLVAAGQTSQANLRFNEEMKKLDRAVELAPSATVPLLQRAQAKRRQHIREQRTGQTLLDSAILDLNKAISIQANFLPAHVAKAEVYMTRTPSDTASAIETLRGVLAMSPREHDIRQSLITLLVGSNQLNQAVRVAQEAISQFPTESRWHETLGDLYANANPPIERGMAMALRSYEEAFRIRPTRDLLAKQSRALLNLPQRDPARVIRLTDGHADMVNATPILRCYRGMAYAMIPEGRRQAEAEFKSAYQQYRAAIDQRNAPAGVITEWFSLIGQAFASLPISDVESIIREIIGGDLTSHEYEALAEQHFRRGSSRALDLLTRAIELADGDDTNRKAQLMFRVGSVHQSYGQYQEAVDLYEQIREIWPNHAATLNNLAFIYADNMGQPAKAEPLARRALELAPENYNILDTMGAVCIALQNFEEAERHLLRSVQIRTESGNLLHLAEVYARTNRINQARQALDQAMKLNPDPKTEREIRQLLDDISRTGS